MKRWNGWGDTTIEYPLTETAKKYLEQKLNPAAPPKDVSLKQMLSKISAPRIKSHSLWSTSLLDRLYFSHGQSFPDWVRLRFGMTHPIPDAVATPTRRETVKTLVEHAHHESIVLIPYGGGTSVVGHVNPLQDERPIVTLNLSRLNQLLDFDKENLTAHFEAGISGALLEATLRAKGYTLGHFPQSFEYSTLGGWIATRSSGQQSLYYGRIEQLFGGGNIVTPQGMLTIPFFPASSAGIDLREMILGSEGRLGVITDAIVKISKLPVEEFFFTVFFRDWEAGIHAVQQIAQSRISVSMLRLSDASETTTHFTLAPHSLGMTCLKRYLSWRGCFDQTCILLVGVTAQTQEQAKICQTAVLNKVHAYHGVYLGKQIGRRWEANRFRAPYLRNTLWSLGYGVDTLETATTWANVTRMKEAIGTALVQAMEKYQESVLVMTHLSQVYPQGSSVYITFVFRLANHAEENLVRWQTMKQTASEAILRVGGTISHQHGVGLDHRAYLKKEKGEIGMSRLQELCKNFDPNYIMNPGKLL